jgi:hypothetical protein
MGEKKGATGREGKKNCCEKEKRAAKKRHGLQEEKGCEKVRI